MKEMKEKNKNKLVNDLNKAKDGVKKMSKKLLTWRMFTFILSIASLLVINFASEIFGDEAYIVRIFNDDYEDDIVSLLVKIGVTLVIFYGFVSLAKVFIAFGKETNDKRKKTWCLLIGNCFKYLCMIFAIMFLLTLFGVDAQALLAGAGVLSLVIGLGCQSLVADIVGGISIMLENNFNVGDIVVVDGFRGEVLAIGIRTTKIKDGTGNIKIINNSKITDIINNSLDLSLVSCCIGFDYDVPLEKVERVIKSNLDRMQQEIPNIVSGLSYVGVTEIKSSEVVVKVIGYCKEENIYQTQRDMNRFLFLLFKENDIAMAFDQITLSYRENPVEENKNK